MRIIFIGTSDFAIPSLKRLHLSNHNIILVLTKPDSPKGRGHKITPSPIKKKALELGYKIKQPLTINNKEFINEIKEYKPDLFVVVSFGEILNRSLLEIPHLGAINVHPSLVPKYRGAAPIQWAIINGDKTTGVTTMLMNRGIDTGQILLSNVINIKANETSISLHKKLSEIGSKLLIETINKIEKKKIIPIEQDSCIATTAPIFKKKDGLINWKKSAQEIDCFIRGINPWPGAFTFYKKKRIKIIKTNIINIDSNDVPGTILESPPRTLYIATKEKIISIEKIQNPSGKKMPISAFICGCHLIPKSILGY